MEFCKHRNSFCYMCGHFVTGKNRKKCNEQFAVWYREQYGDDDWVDEPFAPNVVCSACYSSMQRSYRNPQNMPKYQSPMKWYFPGDHEESDCYFCKNFSFGINTIKSRKFTYQTASNVMLPELRGDNPPPSSIGEQSMANMEVDFAEGFETSPNENVEMNLNENVDVEEITDVVSPSTSSFHPTGQSYIGMKLISQPRLNNMCRRLKLSQRQSLELTRMLKEDNLLAADVLLGSQRNREVPFIPFFANDSNLSYCCNIVGLMEKLNIEYDPTDWRLFIDASKSALKAVLLHNDGAYMPIPIAYSRKLKESYDSMKLIIEKVKYNDHKWDVSGDLKVVALLLGLQLGRTRNACFICTWISTAKIDHYHATWEKRSDYVTGEMNIVKNAVVPREKILLPTLHIKLGLMGSFIRKLNKDRDAFKYLGVLFPKLSLAKRKAGILRFIKLVYQFNPFLS